MTNTHNTVAIDFGYTRTKMAFYNSHDEKTQIMEFRNGSYYMPTSDVAVIRESGEPIVGDKFEHAFENMQKNISSKHQQDVSSLFFFFLQHRWESISRTHPCFLQHSRSPLSL